MVLCKWCGVRPAREAELKWGHRRCSQCRAERHREGRAKWWRTYISNPEAQAKKTARKLRDRQRTVYIGGHEIVMPTLEAKQAAAELIRQRREQYVTQQRFSAGAQVESPAPSAISSEAEL